ncbi:MAG: rhomboid protease GluP [Bradymonadia bacterium]|jgi:rhomboid protease GluP
MLTELFRRALHTLVLDGGATPFAVSDDAAHLLKADGAQQIHVFEHHSDETVLLERMKVAAKALAQTHGDLVLVGGPKSAWSLLKSARPMIALFQLHHIDETGALRQTRPGFRKASLTVLKTLRPLSAADGAEFFARLELGGAEVGAQMDDLHNFGALMAARRPVATWGLVGACVAIFIFQSIFTDSKLVASYLRMGALESGAVQAGEWWRLFSATLLHGNIEHVGFNMVVLWSLGSFLERLVGSTRFLVLYGASALVGSLASVAFLEPGRFSVGASGALWGILAAGGVLAFLRQGPLPDALIPQMRRAALINLGLNTAVSFMPNIDMAAHFGGGLAGALLTWTGVLTLGLVRGETSARVAPAPRWLSGVAVALTLALVGSFGAAMAIGQPWTLNQPATFARVDLPDINTSIEAPTNLARRTATSADGTKVIVFGDARRDGAAIDVLALELPTAVDRAQTVEELKGVIRNSPPMAQAKLIGQPTLVEQGESWVIVGKYSLANGALYGRAFRVDGARLWRVDIGYQSGDTRWAKVAQKMALSVRSLK